MALCSKMADTADLTECQDEQSRVAEAMQKLQSKLRLIEEEGLIEHVTPVFDPQDQTL